MKINNGMNKKDSLMNPDEIDLIEIFEILLRAKKLIIFCTSFLVIISILIVTNLTNVYKSEALLDVSGQKNHDSSISGLTGLASIAGIDVSGKSVDKSTLAIELIQSRAFVKHLISFDNILPSLMAVSEFDSEERKIKYDPKKYNESEKKWVRKSRINRPSMPTYLETYEVYLKKVTVTKDQSTNLIKSLFFRSLCAGSPNRISFVPSPILVVIALISSIVKFCASSTITILLLNDVPRIVSIG